MNRAEQFADLVGRLERAVASLDGLASSALGGSADDKARSARLASKAEGVALALSYAREYRLCDSTSGGPGRSEVIQCLLSPGHDGWHAGLGATWSGGTS